MRMIFAPCKSEIVSAHDSVCYVSMRLSCSDPIHAMLTDKNIATEIQQSTGGRLRLMEKRGKGLNEMCNIKKTNNEGKKQ